MANTSLIVNQNQFLVSVDTNGDYTLSIGDNSRDITVENQEISLSLSRTGGQGTKGDSVATAYIDASNDLHVVINNSAGELVSDINVGGSAYYALLLTVQADAETAQALAETAQSFAETAQTSAETAQYLSENAQSSAETAQASAELALDTFDDRFLGAKTTEPAVDNDGDPLQLGAIYFNTTTNQLGFWSGSSWNYPVALSAENAAIAITNATSASASASAAASSEYNAELSKLAALNSKNAASQSAINAASSENNSETYAGQAQASASSASNSETSAAAFSASSANFAALSEASEDNANDSAQAAQASAAAAVVSSNEATNSANSAGSSAAAASNSAVNANNSAGAASASAFEASSSAASASSNASVTSSNLASIQTIFDNFDDRYLGSKTSDPSLDNDGNPLLVGSIYWNSVEGYLKFYNGTSWEAPSASAANSASAAATSAASASSSQVASASSAADSLSYRNSANSILSLVQTTYDNFDDRYLGTKQSNPTVDNDGNAILPGAIYYNSSSSDLRLYTGAEWSRPFYDATNSASAALASEQAAATSATNALASETAAATSEANALASETAAATSEANAASSEFTASTAASDALTSETAAATSETNAASSASSSLTSANASAASASAALASETASAISETNAASSALAASSSETAAASSETAAGASSTAALASEQAAATSATNAASSALDSANSATASATSASNSNTSALDSASSASAASASETSASSSASAASSSASAASSSASAASSSASAASASASAAATSETNAAASEANALTSETNSTASAAVSTTKASEASASASAAATSETNAANSAFAAASSETNAATSETNAQSIFDDFDASYLGAKATDPAVDNNGNPLLVGALFFDTTVNRMKIWAGTDWQLAYVSLGGALVAANNLSDVESVATSINNLGLGTESSVTHGDITTDYISFDTAAAHTAVSGELAWNADESTLDLGLNANVTLQLGQEQVAFVRNTSGVDILNGDVVRVTGASGNKITVSLANAGSEGASSTTFGVATEAIPNNSSGFITFSGIVRELDTSSYSEGQALWLAAGGGFTSTKPLSPNHLVQIGWVTRSHATEGAIYVSINNGWEFGELHDVLLTSVADNDILSWDNSAAVWKNTADVTLDSLTTTGVVSVGTNLTVGGDLIVNGTTTTINATELAIVDNMIYLNEGSTVTNPDLGWVGNYNDGTYAHAGIFRDATDGVFKFFKGYTPEPGQAIDTSHASYTAASIQASTVDTTTVTLNGWTITETNGHLYFSVGGLNKMKLDSSGNLQVVGNVDSNATIT
jgi:hypothetical protein